MAQEPNTTASQNEIVLAENEMVCSLTNRVVKATQKIQIIEHQIFIY